MGISDELMKGNVNDAFDKVGVIFLKIWNGWLWFVDKMTTKWTLVALLILFLIFAAYLFWQENYARFDSIKQNSV